MYVSDFSNHLANSKHVPT